VRVDKALENHVLLSWKAYRISGRLEGNCLRLYVIGKLGILSQITRQRKLHSRNANTLLEFLKS